VLLIIWQRKVRHKHTDRTTEVEKLRSSKGQVYGEQLILEPYVRAIGEESPVFESEVFGEEVGLMGKIFGCGHEELSRPFSIM
jgi:hypothetical protein